MKLAPISATAAASAQFIKQIDDARTVEQFRARFAISRSPLAIDVSFEDFEQAPRGARIIDLLPDHLRCKPVVCIVNNQFIARAEWSTPVRQGEVVIFHTMPQGGGGGSNPLRILLTLAVLYASVQFGGILGGALGFSGSTAAAVGGFLINFAGSLAINALVPMPKAGGAGGGAGESPSPTYTASFQGNQARLEQPIPIGYGQNFQFPDFAAQPYVEYVGNEQFYHAIFCIGKGRYDVLRVQIDDTDIRSFSDVTTQIVGPSQSVTNLEDQQLVKTAMVTAQQVAGQTLTTVEWVGAFAVCYPGYKVTEIGLDIVFPRGLGAINTTNGNTESRSLDVEFQYLLVDDNDKALGTWTALGAEKITAGTSTPQSRTFKYAIAAGRYQVRIRRVALPSGLGTVFDEIVWAGMRAVLNMPGILDSESTFIVVKIRASAQLSGQSQRKFGVLWKRYLQVWDGSVWTEQFTRNPAWALADIWRNKSYGRGLPDSRIDLDTLLQLSKVWDARQDNFDFIFDSKTTIFEAAQTAARAGRAVAIMRRGRYTVVRDTKQVMPVAMYTPRNIRKNSLQIEFAMPSEDMPDAVRVKYHSGKTWAEKSIIAQVFAGNVYVYRENQPILAGQAIPGTTDYDLLGTQALAFAENMPDPTHIQEVTLEGVVGEKQAMREAAYIIAAGHFRRQTVSWSTDCEGLLPAFGSLVAVSHDVPNWGQSGTVAAVDAGTLRVRVSQDLNWQPGEQHYVRFVSATGEVSEPLPVIACNDGDINEFRLPSMPFELIGEDADRDATRFAFGTSTNVIEYVRIKAIKPRGPNQIDISGVVEDARVHESDSFWLAATGQTQDALNDGSLSLIQMHA